MSLEELWQLFPIELQSHNRQWAQWAAAEIGELSELLAAFSPTINHIGSTAIPGIIAKPIVDILVEIPAGYIGADLKAKLETAGYICMNTGENRMNFNKGYTSHGYAEKVFHIHVHACGDNDEIYFRDYLRSHTTTAREYEQLKMSLLPEYRHNRDGYTAAKTSFIKKIISYKIK